MFNYCSLYSGSSGNSFLVQTSNAKILIDCGVSGKKVVDALSNCNISISDINAILVTHEHIDHTKSLGLISSRYNIPVYANEKTWDALGPIKDKISDTNKKIFNTKEKFNIADLEILPFLIPHDAAAPCGFNIFNDSKKLSIVTDIGHISNTIINKLEGSSSILLESNYDPDILKYSTYPYLLKQRISGPNGHLENKMAGKTISTITNDILKNILLVHLSKENNFPELAYKTVCEEISNLNNLNISVAPRDKPSEIFKVI